MAFLEIKGSLAKLLATENLHVQHDALATTASFNTATRVLTLPVLQTENQHVYDMFIGHEVGHALYTPETWRDEVPDNVPFDFVNVVEDVRIEKMIQAKFPGLRKDFNLGYTDLNDRDFFAISDKDLGSLAFVDRINLHFKLGSRALIPFSDEEMVYVRMVEDCKTFDDVCFASKMIAQFVNAKRQEEQPEVTQQVTDGDGETETDTDNDNGQENQKPNQEEGEEPVPSKPDEQVDENKSETQEALDKNLERISGDKNSRVTYLKAPHLNINQNITPIEFYREDYNTKLDESTNYARQRVEEQYNDFMKSIRRDVNFMVQQFEMRKSADAYARQQVNKTGVLDTEKLHQYKLTDDIFLRQTVTPDGKSHGMVILLDWSGSMQDKVVATVKQLLVLAQFCRKVGIAFDVYTFTCNGYGTPRYDDSINDIDDYDMRVATCGPILVQVLSSSVKRSEMEQDMRNLLGNASSLSCGGYYYPTSTYLHMGGTPLNNTLFFYPELIRRLKERSGSQKISTVTMTDGESSPLYFNTISRYREGSLQNNMISPYDTILLKDGTHTYQLDHNTGSIVTYLQKKMSDVTFTHIFLGGPKISERYVNWISDFKQEFDSNTFRKTGSNTLTNVGGWPLVALVNPNSFGETTDELQVDNGASKAQLRGALRKMLKTKSSSKVLLTQLVQQFS